MPTAMTFTSLQEDLRRYLERGSVVDPTVYAQLPRLINQSERAISREIKVEGFINVVTSDLIAGTSVYAKPDRWRRTISMEYGVGVAPNQVRYPIFPRSYEYCRSYWPNPDTQQVPEFYADYDYAHWLIVPTPVINHPWEIIYYQLLPLLDDVNQTNWLTDYAPNALLYRTLLDCEPFLKNDERMNTWKTLYAAEVAALNAEDLQKTLDRATVRREA